MKPQRQHIGPVRWSLILALFAADALYLAGTALQRVGR